MNSIASDVNNILETQGSFPCHPIQIGLSVLQFWPRFTTNTYKNGKSRSQSFNIFFSKGAVHIYNSWTEKETRNMTRNCCSMSFRDGPLFFWGVSGLGNPLPPPPPQKKTCTAKTAEKKSVQGELWEKKNRANALYYPGPVFEFYTIDSPPKKSCTA